MVDGRGRFPDVRHVAVGGDPAGAPVTTVDASSESAIRQGVRDIVATA